MESRDEQLGIVTEFIAFKDPFQVLATLAYEKIQAISSLASDELKEGLLFIAHKI